MTTLVHISAKIKDFQKLPKIPNSVHRAHLRICSLAQEQEGKEVAEQEIVPRQVQKYVGSKKAVLGVPPNLNATG